MKRTKRQKGFTLVELLVVIVILGILSSVVVGVVPSATARAREVAFGATLSTLQSACDRFYVESNMYPAEVQPESGVRAGALDYEATDGQGQTFLGGYLQFAPSDNSIEMGLSANGGPVVYYGVTSRGRVFATQEEPVEGAWVDGEMIVYVQDDMSGDQALGDIW